MVNCTYASKIVVEILMLCFLFFLSTDGRVTKYQGLLDNYYLIYTVLGKFQIPDFTADILSRIIKYLCYCDILPQTLQFKTTQLYSLMVLGVRVQR